MNYTLNFRNNSTNHGNACIYQTSPNFGPEILSLGWFSKAAHPNTTIDFGWTLDYSFVWADSGKLKNKILYTAAEVKEADTETNNIITLDYDDAYKFIDASVKGTTGSFTITETADVPLKQAVVGIGMSGAGTFVKKAQPNETLVFTPTPHYWIVFGSYEQGEVMNITEMTNAKEIKFPHGVTAMTATLNEDNTFTIAPTE